MLKSHHAIHSKPWRFNAPDARASFFAYGKHIRGLAVITYSCMEQHAWRDHQGGVIDIASGRNIKALQGWVLLDESRSPAVRDPP